MAGHVVEHTDRGASGASAGAAQPPPPGPRRAGYSWAWWLGGSLLALGGLANFTGAWLRWFGPMRQPSLAMRQNDSSTPLTMGRHVVPYSSELTAAGYLLVAAALVALIFLTWRRLRWVAAPALLLGAYSFAGPALLWLRERLTGIDSTPAYGVGWEPVDAWSAWAWEPAMLVWILGLAPVILLACAAVRASATDDGVGPDRRWAPVVTAFALLTASAMVLEVLVLTMFDVSHDDPQGFGMYSGSGQVLAGAFVVAGAVRGRRGSGPHTPPSAGVGDSRPSPRGRRALQVGGALIVLSGLVGLALLATAATGPDAAQLPEDAPHLTGRFAAGIAGQALFVAGTCALVAGPWRGWRRLLAAVGAALALVPAVGSIVGTLELMTGGESGWWARNELPATAWNVLGAVVFALTLVLARLAEREPSTSGSERALPLLPVLLGTILVVLAQPLVLLNIGLADSPEAPLATLPGLITAVVTVLWGLAWWVTGRTGRRAAENVPAEADRD